MYIYGGVGRGKSLMMDAFFKVSRHRRKRRVHFHEFMREIHARLRALSGQADPLDLISTEIARELRLLAFDEFHVSDIADAMILARLPRAPDRQGRGAGPHLQLQPDEPLSQRPAARALPARRSRSSSATSTWWSSAAGPTIAGGSSTASGSTTRRSTRRPTRSSRGSSRR
jgi:hypothetical protein